MLEATARRKVPGGKLLAVRLKHDGLHITDAEVSGDFFLYPEESIVSLEKVLIGLPVAADEEELIAAISEAMGDGHITALGFDARSLAAVVLEALR
ncbi:MAG: lipoate protein ligase C-terminal domain-containing protein [Methanomassiliicoccus sp.]|nr:lipoate protein ligase C-terminal domain-containing protein [Methanomassiliicoccus sp.]